MDDHHNIDVNIPSTSQMILSQSLTIEIEPDEILSHSNNLCLYKVKARPSIMKIYLLIIYEHLLLVMAFYTVETLMIIIQLLHIIIIQPIDTEFFWHPL